MPAVLAGRVSAGLQADCPVVRFMANVMVCHGGVIMQRRSTQDRRADGHAALRNVAEKLFVGRVLRAFFVRVLAAMKGTGHCSQR
jgi:hypothetical protein